MKEFKHVIADPLGMHARPAGMLVKAVAGYASKITIAAPTGTAPFIKLSLRTTRVELSNFITKSTQGETDT